MQWGAVFPFNSFCGAKGCFMDVSVRRLICNAALIDELDIEGISSSKKWTDVIKWANTIQYQNKREFFLRSKVGFVYTLELPKL